MGRHRKSTRKIHQWCRLTEEIILALGGTVTNKDNRSQLLLDWEEAIVTSTPQGPSHIMLTDNVLLGSQSVLNNEGVYQ